ncbi:unnamed protein product [Urochloa humidicola]
MTRTACTTTRPSVSRPPLPARGPRGVHVSAMARARPRLVYPLGQGRANLTRDPDGLHVPSLPRASLASSSSSPSAARPRARAAPRRPFRAPEIRPHPTSSSPPPLPSRPLSLIKSPAPPCPPPIPSNLHYSSLPVPLPFPFPFRWQQWTAAAAISPRRVAAPAVLAAACGSRGRLWIRFDCSDLVSSWLLVAFSVFLVALVCALGRSGVRDTLELLLLEVPDDLRRKKCHSPHTIETSLDIQPLSTGVS